MSENTQNDDIVKEDNNITKNDCSYTTYTEYTMQKDYNLEYFYCNDSSIDKDIKPGMKPPTIENLQ